MKGDAERKVENITGIILYQYSIFFQYLNSLLKNYISAFELMWTNKLYQLKFFSKHNKQHVQKHFKTYHHESLYCI